jgi:hypothetical protein
MEGREDQEKYRIPDLSKFFPYGNVTSFIDLEFEFF